MIRTKFPLYAVAVAALLVPSLASGQLRDVKAVSIEAAMTMADAAMAHAEANGWNVVIAITDASGELLLLRRMDGAQVGSVDIAIAKASASARFRRETKAFADAVAGGATPLLSVDGVIMLEGGVPIYFDGTVIGGIGVSGVTSAQDAQIAKAGVAALRP